MNYSIEQGAHSADKDHTIMTGGTLSIDKIVRCDEGVTFYTYQIPMYQGVFDELFHKGVHTSEHLLAYKKDTGSVRNSLEEVTDGKIDGKVILDISPYRTGEDSYGFRITSMIPLESEKVRELAKLSIKRAIDFLESGISENKDDFMKIPFARPESCGQYNFHDVSKAIVDLKQSLKDELVIKENQIKGQHKAAYVCDLRFLKPKLEGKDEMIMFTPDFSYHISELIEKHLPSKLKGAITLVGTFGCMTGMYLCVSSQQGDKTDISFIHSCIIEILKENIDINSLGEEEQIQFKTLMNNYKNYSR